MDSPSLPPTSTAPFKFVGGDLALDLVNTVDWTEQGLVLDRLGDYPRLTGWAEAAGVLRRSQAASLRRSAAQDPAGAGQALRLAGRLRSAIRECAAALSEQHDPSGPLGQLNALLPRALTRLRLEREYGQALSGVQLGWEGLGQALDSPLWPVLWSALHLFTSPQAARIRRCSGEACGWTYVDRSRNGLRRWCQMSTCGTTAKNRRRGRQPRAAS